MSGLRDPGSGLLTEDYFEVAVPERVAIARRALRPVSVVLLRAEGELSAVERAEIVRSCLRDSDTACQLRDDTIGLILEETPEDGAVWTTERLRRDLEATGRGVRVWAGVATYPAHTLEAVELLRSAVSALAEATAWPGSRIEVARQR